MKSKYKLAFVIGILIGVFLILLIISQISAALEPKLLWKREIPSFVWQIDFARYSGDVIFAHEGNRITMFDKNGNTKWQWGPHLDKLAGSPIISDDGKHFIYSSYPTGGETDYMKGTYIHYCESNGREIWKKEEPLLVPSTISPDGKYIVLGVPGGWGGGAEFLDSNGKLLWKIEGPALDAIFSPDGNYLAVFPDIYDLNGNKYNEKEIAGNYNSFSNNGEYIGIEIIYFDPNIEIGPDEGLYDKKGNLVFPGKNAISGSGKIVISYLKNKIEAYRFPEKIKIAEYPIKRWRFPFCNALDYRFKYSKISYDGRYVAIFGERTDTKTPYSLFVIDINENKIWGVAIPGVEYEERDENIFSMSFTNDGKYLMFLHANDRAEKSTLYFYQIQ